MLFDDICQFLLLLLIISIFVIVIKTLNQIRIKKFLQKKSISYDLYSALHFVWIDATVQTIIFLMFDWHISALLWLTTIPLSLWLFKYLYKNKIFVKKYNVFTEKFSVSPQNNTKTKVDILLQRELRKEEYIDRPILFNTVISNPIYHISWLSVHLSAPALIWISIFLESTTLLPSISFSSTLDQMLYDVLCSYGACSIIYWIGYAIDSMGFRYKNWRRWYHVIYFVFLIIWWTLFVLVELHMLN